MYCSANKGVVEVTVLHLSYWRICNVQIYVVYRKLMFNVWSLICRIYALHNIFSRFSILHLSVDFLDLLYFKGLKLIHLTCLQGRFLSSLNTQSPALNVVSRRFVLDPYNVYSAVFFSHCARNIWDICFC